MDDAAVETEVATVGEQLRAEMGGQRPVAAATEVFEPADPARTMPKGLVFGTIAAVIVLILIMTWLNKRSLEPANDTANVAVTEAPVPPPQAAPAPAPVGNQPVVLTATAPVWLQVYEKGGASLFSGTLQQGQTFAVPATATAPLLKTGKPEALRISVGNAIAPAVGPPATTVRDVSLLGADLMKGGTAASPAAAPPPQPQPRAAQRVRRAQPRAARRPEPPSAAPTTNTGE
jgi:hypothetical protein